MAEEYNLMKQCLQGLKGLTEKEADAFFRICSKKSVCVKDVVQIFADLKTKVSRSKAYTIVDKMKKAGLLQAINASGKKQEYKAIHPRAILNNLKQSLKNIDKDVAKLEQVYETSDFEEQDPRDLSKILRSEDEVRSACYVLNKDCDMHIILNKKQKPTASFLQGLTDCGKVNEGAVNAILFKHKNDSRKGVIHISTRPEKGGNLRIFGQVLYCQDKYDYLLKREVKKK